MPIPILFTDAVIHTGVSETDAASSMLVKDGRIIALDSEPVGRFKRISLEGRHVYPCLIDGHTHLLQTVVLAAAGFDVCDITQTGVEPHDIAGVERRLRDFAAGKPRSAVLVGNSYIPSAVKERRLPSKLELDDWGGGRAMAIYTIDGHASALSTAMLIKLGLDPADSDGVFAGEAHERIQGRMMDIIGNSVTPGLIAKGVANFHNACARYGISCVGALEGFGDSKRDPTAKLILQLARRFAVDVRMYFQYMDIDRALPYHKYQAHPRIGGCGDWEMDGAVGAHSAAFSLPYRDTGSNAPLYYAQDYINTQVEKADARGLQIASHAIGDMAIGRILEALRHTTSGIKHRIEHCEFADDAEIEEIASRGYAVMMQPGYSWIDKRFLHTYSQFLPDEITSALKLKTLYDKGICVCGSSDSPVQELDPWLQMLGMVQFYNDEESLTPYEAFRCYTVHPAAALLEAEERGTLEPGKVADFFTADTELFALPPASIVSFRPHATYYGGKPARVWRGTLAELALMMLSRPRQI